MRLGHIPANSTSLPNSRFKIVDKLFTEQGVQAAVDTLAQDGLDRGIGFGTAIDTCIIGQASEIAEASDDAKMAQ